MSCFPASGEFFHYNAFLTYLNFFIPGRMSDIFTDGAAYKPTEIP
jgi:hypothetical protein